MSSYWRTPEESGEEYLTLDLFEGCDSLHQSTSTLPDNYFEMQLNNLSNNELQFSVDQSFHDNNHQLLNEQTNQFLDQQLLDYQFFNEQLSNDHILDSQFFGMFGDPAWQPSSEALSKNQAPMDSSRSEKDGMTETLKREEKSERECQLEDMVKSLQEELREERRNLRNELQNWVDQIKEYVDCAVIVNNSVER